jgi:O-antigen/teichoic acid export membrane protein
LKLQQGKGKSLIAKNVVINLGSQIVPMLAALLTIPYVVKGLGTDGYGILSIAYMVLGYFSIFDLGLSRATVKFVAEHLSPEKIHKVPEIVWTSLFLLVLLGFVSGGIAAIFVPLAVTHFFKMPASFVGQAKSSLLIICLSLPILLANDALRGVLEAAQRFDLVNWIKIPGSTCFYLFAAGAVALRLKVPWVIVALVLVRLVTACAYLVVGFRIIPELRAGIRVSRSALRSLATFGGWVMVSNICGPIFTYLERFFVASVVSVSMLTYYSIPFDLLSKTIMLPASLATALFPYFSHHGGGNSDLVSDVTSRSVKYLLFVMTPFTAVLLYFSKEILQLWMGAQFANQSAVVMQLLAVMFLLNALSFVPYTSVQALGRPELKAKLDIAALPIYALFLWLLVRPYGINGAAAAKLLITALDTGVLFLFAWKMKSFALRDCISGPLFRTLVASGALLVLGFLIHVCRITLVNSAVLFGLCITAYAILLWFAAVDGDEKTVIRSFSRVLLLKG